MIKRRSLLAGGTALLSAATLTRHLPAHAQTASLRIATLKFGSLSWLLDTITTEGLDKKHGLNLDIVVVASNSAGPVAMLSDDVDIMVSDWPWAMRQRSIGEPLRFAPYTSSLGAIMVEKDGGVASIADLTGKTIGVAGSSIDKSWILLRAYSRKILGKDIATIATPSFGAAPLIAEQLRAGRMDAVLNFWTFSARLAGFGYRELLSMADVLRELGVDPVPPLVGFVWKEKIQTQKAAQIAAFHACVAEANALLATDDAAWMRLKPSMRVQTDGEFEALKRYYRAGIPKPWSDTETGSAEKLLQLLKDLGQKDLVGSRTRFDAKLFHGTGN